MARSEAVLQRSQRAEKLTSYQLDDIVLDFQKLTASNNDQPLSLSAREFRLLEYFVNHRGEEVMRDQLLQAVWEYDRFPLTRTVDMYITKLRQKIKPTPRELHFIIIVHRVGY